MDQPLPVKQQIYIIEFSEGELAELLTVIEHECRTSQYYPDYYRKLCQKIQKQVNYQLEKSPFRCAVCRHREQIRAEIELS